MAEITQVLQTPSFSKATKRLYPNQKQDLDKAIRTVMHHPLLGEQKKGDLAFLRVSKFKMQKQPTLLGYHYENGAATLALIAVAPHENFYRNVRKVY